MNETAFSRMLDAIYDAAVSPAQWPIALGRLGGIFGCHRAILVARNLKTMQGCVMGSSVDAASDREYFGIWRHRNIFNAWTKEWRPGAIVTDQDILPKTELLRSDYYNEFLKPRDAFALLRLSLRTEDGIHQSISLTRSRSAGEYERPEIEQARAFLPHLQRAARITQHLGNSELLLDATTELLERNPTGVVLLDRTGRIVFANRAARAMAESGDSFVLRKDRIEALRQPDDAALRALVAGATGRAARQEAPRGGVMRLSHLSGARGHVVAVGPLTDGSKLFAGIAPAAFVLISDPEKCPVGPRSMWRSIYGLTATETRMAERLMKGDTPEQAAEALAIKISTARGHLAALFRKTDTSRQSELIRLLLSLPWSEGEVQH